MRNAIVTGLDCPRPDRNAAGVERRGDTGWIHKLPATASTTRARFGPLDFAAPEIGDRYGIFISSAEECVLARKLCRDTIDTINPSLSEEPGAPMLVPKMWEDALPQRVDGESINDFFVRVALECHATIVLLEAMLGRGTREEVLALLDRPAAERKPLAVVVFRPRSRGTRSPELVAFMRDISSNSGVLYRTTETMGSQRAALMLAQVMWGFAFSAARTSRSRPVENDGL